MFWNANRSPAHLISHPLLWILVVSAVLRLVLITSSFWLDEAAQALESSRPISQQLDIASDFQPPLYHVWLHLFTYLSHAEWWLRLASLIPGIISIALVYGLGLGVSKTVAIWSSVLLATSQFHIFYSQELRPYSFAVMWGLVMLLSLQWFSKTQHKRWLWLAVVASIAGIYSIYTFPFFLLAVFMWLVWEKKISWNQMVIWILSLTLSFLPWLPHFMVQFKTGIALKQSLPHWSEAVSFPILKVIPLSMQKFAFGRLDVDYSLAIFVFSILALSIWLISFLVSFSRNGSPQKSWLVMIMTTILIGYLVHLWIPIFEPKRFMILLPVSLLLIASLHTHRLFRHALPLLLVIQLSSVMLYWTNNHFQREDWRRAVYTLENQLPADSLSLFSFYAPFAPYEWYQTNKLSSLSIMPIHATEVELEALAENLKAYEQVALFEYLTDLTDPTDRLGHILDLSGELVDTKTYPNLGRIFIYQMGKY